MWILKFIVGAICFFLCLFGSIIWFIPALLMWNMNATNAYYEGVWKVYEKFFEKV